MSGTTTDHASPIREWHTGPVVVLRSFLPVAAGRWERAVVVGSLAAAALAIWLTLRAGFLAHPGWLAAQKADFILGPIGVGLYWHYKRPHNRLGLLLILLGLLGAAYIGSSLSAPFAFGIGVFVEVPLVFFTEAAILAFPTGRLEGPVERGILVFMALTFVVGRTAIWLTSPVASPWFSISECRGTCPANGEALWSPLAGTSDVISGIRVAVIVAAVSTIALLVWKFVAGTPPRRRALVIGAPIAVLYLLLQISFQGLQLISPGHTSAAAKPVTGAIDWAFAGARSAVWYGFLFALIAAELYAGRVLRALVQRAVQHPDSGELETMLRGPLGDPGLRLGFRDSSAGGWVDAEGAVLKPDVDQRLTAFERDSGPAIGIAHDAELSDEPELLETAGEIAIMALEHVELEAAQRESLSELAESRARLVETSDRERRRLERDLHDGAQQRLTAIQIRLRLAMEQAHDERLVEQLEAISADAEEAIDELRELSHGIYPTVLRSAGPVMALRALAMRTPIPVTVADGGIGRCSSAVEAAIYFCCAEAVQNATKHAGPEATVKVSLDRASEGIRFTIADDGVGTPGPTTASGDGISGMRDRIGAVGGTLEISSAPGRGVTVRGSIPAGGLEASIGED